MNQSRQPEDRPRHVITPRSVRAVEREEGLLFPLSIEETKTLVRAALDEIHVLARQRRDARQVLHEVERHPLGAQQAARFSRQEKHRCRRPHARAVLGIDAYRYRVIELTERFDRQ